MSLILIIAIIWGASALIHSAREKRAKENAQRVASEQARIKREMREMKQRANAEVAARIALEREQMRLAKEQEKERNEREAADAKLAKRIEALEYKVRQLDRNIEAQNETLAEYYAQLDWLLLQQSGTVAGGKEFAAWQNKIVTKNNQIRKAECKLADMNDAKERAEKEMEVA